MERRAFMQKTAIVSVGITGALSTQSKAEESLKRSGTIEILPELTTKEYRIIEWDIYFHRGFRIPLWFITDFAWLSKEWDRNGMHQINTWFESAVKYQNGIIDKRGALIRTVDICPRLKKNESYRVYQDILYMELHEPPNIISLIYVFPSGAVARVEYSSCMEKDLRKLVSPLAVGPDNC